MIFNDPDCIFAFSHRPHNMSLSYGDTADTLKNRRSFLYTIGIEHEDLVCAQQVHGGMVRLVDLADRGRGALSYETVLPATDALITQKRRLPLAVFTADCLSVFLYDPHGPSVGLVHAGWRGSREGIVKKTVQLMQKECQARAEDLRVAFGPAIRACCYEVGGEFRDYFEYGILRQERGFFLDLLRINARQLQEAGVKESNISDSGICTSCQAKEYFSFRKEGDSCGRMMSVIMLK